MQRESSGVNEQNRCNTVRSSQLPLRMAEVTPPHQDLRSATHDANVRPLLHGDGVRGSLSASLAWKRHHSVLAGGPRVRRLFLHQAECAALSDASGRAEQGARPSSPHGRVVSPLRWRRIPREGRRLRRVPSRALLRPSACSTRPSSSRRRSACAGEGPPRSEPVVVQGSN